jgi:unsaturated chondroitin disaccharide hydrolase
MTTHHEPYAPALAFAAAQARRIIAEYPGYHPMYTVDGRWNREGVKWTHWCEGFFPGILWLLHQATGDAFYREQAEVYSLRLEPRQGDDQVHDLGFIFFSTYLRWYHLTGEDRLRQVLIQAGRTLATRFQPRGQYVASFLGPQSLFIDIMMNIGLVLWAARETGDAALRELALAHCRTTARHLVRDDGSTAHEGIFDTTTGSFLRESTQQGAAPDSAWSRGQAWAIYGFTAVHRLSGEAEFLEVAQRCAQFWMEHLPAEGVPYWDFRLPPGGPTHRDSSAAAIAASGFLDLADAVPAKASEYRAVAQRMLDVLCRPPYLACDDPAWEGILKHGVYHLHKGLGVDESVAWGDHFFVEALVKATQRQTDGPPPWAV